MTTTPCSTESRTTPPYWWDVWSSIASQSASLPDELLDQLLGDADRHTRAATLFGLKTAEQVDRFARQEKNRRLQALAVHHVACTAETASWVAASSGWIGRLAWALHGQTDPDEAAEVVTQLPKSKAWVWMATLDDRKLAMRYGQRPAFSGRIQVAEVAFRSTTPSSGRPPHLSYCRPSGENGRCLSPLAQVIAFQALHEAGAPLGSTENVVFGWAQSWSNAANSIRSVDVPVGATGNFRNRWVQDSRHSDGSICDEQRDTWETLPLGVAYDCGTVPFTAGYDLPVAEGGPEAPVTFFWKVLPPKDAVAAGLDWSVVTCRSFEVFMRLAETTGDLPAGQVLELAVLICGETDTPAAKFAAETAAVSAVEAERALEQQRVLEGRTVWNEEPF